MQLTHIEFSQLKISKTNMRYRDPPPDVADILPSIRQKGVLMPLLVRAEDASSAWSPVAAAGFASRR